MRFRLLFFIGFLCLGLTGYSQDSLNEPDLPQPDLPPMQLPKIEAPENQNGESHSGGSNTYYPKAYKRLDTIFRADPRPINIISFDAPASGRTLAMDTSVQSAKPVVEKVRTVQATTYIDNGFINGLRYDIPFQYPRVEPILFSHYFNMPDSILKGQTLYLYFEGIAWRSEVRLNGKFLGVNEDPFAPWVIPINAQWLRESQNLLEIKMERGKYKTFYPGCFLGIFRPLYIVNALELAALRKEVTPIKETTPLDVAIIAPYYQKNGFIFDKLEAVKALHHALNNGFRYVWFPLPPSREMRELVQQMGLGEVKKIKPNQKVSWINDYPIHSRDFPYKEMFWLKGDYRTTNYGTRSSLSYVNPETATSFGWFVLAVLPLIALFLLKILNPTFFYLQLNVLVQPRLYLDKFLEITQTNQFLAFILSLLRVSIISALVVLLLFYVQQNNQWDILHFGNKEEGLLLRFFAYKQNLGWVFLKVFLMIGTWAAARYFLFQVLSASFRIHNMSGLTQGLELLGTYPLLFVLPLPMIFLQFSPNGQGFLLFLQVVLLLGYILRQVYVSYVGLEKLFGFSDSVKLLYILGFIIFPYVICL